MIKTIMAFGKKVGGLKDNLISYWAMDETGNVTREDSHGSNDLGPTNMASASGKINNASDFEADSPSALGIASNSTLQAGDIDFTISAWVQLESKGAIRNIVAKRSGIGALEYYLRYLDSADRFNFEVSPDGSTPVTSINADSFGSPSTATWYFIVCWHDSVNNKIAIQVNNGTVDETAHSGGVFAGTTQFNVGTSVAGDHWDGLIDEVGFWKRVLTADERSQLYNSGNGLAYSSF